MISSIEHRPVSDLPPPAPSALTSFIQSSNPTKASQTHEPYYHHLASQILHNLRYQHDWTSLRIHTLTPPSTSSNLLPRPLISGLPPQRIYIHPDEQVELLKQEKDKSGNGDVSEGHNGEEKVEGEGMGTADASEGEVEFAKVRGRFDGVRMFRLDLKKKETCSWSKTMSW
jgi:hypothetical protein